MGWFRKKTKSPEWFAPYIIIKERVNGNGDISYVAWMIAKDWEIAVDGSVSRDIKTTSDIGAARLHQYNANRITSTRIVERIDL